MATFTAGPMAAIEEAARESARRYDAVFGQGNYYIAPREPVKDSDLKGLRDALCGK